MEQPPQAEPPPGAGSQRLGAPPPPGTAAPLPGSEQPPSPPGGDDGPGWPAWYGPAAFAGGLAATVVLVGVVAGIAASAGADVSDESPGLTIVGTLMQAVAFAGAALLFATLTRPPRASDFGLRPARFWPAVGWAALGLLSFYVFAGIYSALLSPDGEQTVTESLGADEGTVTLILAGFVVIVIAPVAEEFFFRGFFYRALRSRFSVLVAALLDGLLFGAIHFSGGDTLELLPILAVLGFVFCLVYERTGTLYTVIGLHAINNTIAYSVQAEGSTGVAVALGAAMLVGCALVPRFTGARPQPAPT